MSEAEPRGSGWTIVWAVVIGVAMMGFIRGTSDADFQPEPAIRAIVQPDARDGEAPRAQTYAEKRMDRPTGEDTVHACVDCHRDRATSLRSGHHVEHPVGGRIGGRAVEALTAAGGRVDLDDQGRPIVSCRSCHRPHNAEIDPRLVLPADTGELCQTCHADHRGREGAHPIQGAIPAALARSVARLGADSERLGCTTCHSLHQASSGNLLRTPRTGTAACRSCHPDQDTALAGGGHGGRFCEDCHGMHRPPDHAGQGPVAAHPADQPCANCHLDGGSSKRIDPGRGHLSWASEVGCSDCHVPHGTGTLLAGGDTTTTCVRCHEEKGSVQGTKHAGDGCTTCHDVHGERPPVAAGVNPASAVCLRCHDGERARTVAHYDHPTGLLFTVDGLPARYAGQIPYFGPDGKRTSDRARGEITCQSCHDPHTWKHDSAERPGDVEGTEQDSFLRDPDEIVVFCSVCHGVDARPRFRFFHEDRYRSP